MAKSKAGKGKKMSTKRRAVKDLGASKAQSVKGGLAGGQAGKSLAAIKF
jgi:hypothetical protein